MEFPFQQHVVWLKTSWFVGQLYCCQPISYSFDRTNKWIAPLAEVDSECMCVIFDNINHVICSIYALKFWPRKQHANRVNDLLSASYELFFHLWHLENNADNVCMFLIISYKDKHSLCKYALLKSNILYYYYSYSTYLQRVKLIKESMA